MCVLTILNAGAMDWPEFFVSVAVAFVAGFAFEALLEKIGG